MVKLYRLCQIAFCGFIAIGLMCQPLNGREIYAVLVADSFDATIGKATGNALALMEREIHKIASATGLKLHLESFQGLQATADRVVAAIVDLPSKSDDIIIVYFAMHGFREPSKSDCWPYLFLGPSGQGVDFLRITKILKAKRPAFIFALADCCNNLVPEGSIPIYRFVRKSAHREYVSKNYRHLFLDARGHVIISSAIPGEPSWALVGEGGIYTLSFLETLGRCAEKKKLIEWQDLIGAVSKNVTHQLLFFDKIQTAQYDLKLSKYNNKSGRK